MAEMVCRILTDWAGLESTPGGFPAPGPTELPLELRVRVDGPLNFLLVLRSVDALGPALAVASTGDPGASAFGEDAFYELSHLASEEFIKRLPKDGSTQYRSRPPEPSHPVSWPAEEPLSQSVLFVEKLPLELRLWCSDRPGAGQPRRGGPNFG
jgi:hypothetical protein